MPAFVQMKQDESAIRDLQRKLRAIPQKLKTRELTKVVRAMATPIVKKARAIVPIGPARDVNKVPRLKDTLDKRVKGYRASGTAVAIVGHRSGKAPHAHLVHEGVKPHIIRVGFTTSGSGTVRPSLGSQGRPPLSLSNQKRFFGKRVKHPGITANPYLRKATDQSKSKSLANGAKKARQILEKLAKE